MIQNKTGFNRAIFLAELKETDLWDIIIIGGGATGLGSAVDAASRGYKTLLLEQVDYAKGTSSRSTKLVHGGVRYLAQGNIRLVYEALQERGLLLQNAPHLVKPQSFIIPCYSWLAKAKYLIGLKIYDWLAAKFSFGVSGSLTKQEVLAAVPEIKKKALKGGIEYWDGQFDDARLAISLARTSAEHGGSLLNYIKVTGLLKTEEGRINGVMARDTESGVIYNLRSKAVINATGVFVDEIMQMDEASQRPLVRSSQGVHIVLNKSFLKGNKAIMIPQTADGRVLFAVPWHEHVLVGTTDTPLGSNSLEPVALNKEIEFILATAKQYLTQPPTRKDVLSVFAGLRPLAAPDKKTNSTKEISRGHKIIVSDSGLVTVIGGKWTTYRKMAEDTIDKVIKTAGLKMWVCITRDLKIHGYRQYLDNDYLSVYGSDKKLIASMIIADPKLAQKLAEDLPYQHAEVIWAVRHEMARTVEDVLARRLRILFLDAKKAMAIAPVVAELIAKELGYDQEWQRRQVINFIKLANNYLIGPYTS
ncbi:glycerol-3-phosphate dehydrogenase/oxidase [Mucilaginibacter sp. UR6-11]|uniref:glycerol-3-phosphate dehydrogenase/oxidase n=1 Tax=Mucilaginibacter sp. UR6-11 TaxID=1435644 RepID=UPI001E34812A|nr:glycerol-3-phosphate dehydrogenase/oxidase [Mucilaginibacter sp. UR6-11]MCC8425461.1 glycerol-3-phosphate dehydrogenase/oxidase [Mucilaginibacter sp. UR6-11]